MRPKTIKVIFSEWDGYCKTVDRNGCISYPVTITWIRAERDYDQPVVVILGETREAPDMPPGELQVPSEILDKVRQAGYGAQQLSVREIKDYWRAAGRLSVKNHWHPEARLVQY